MITWDEAKRRRNIAKHGLDLADAARFDWEHAVYEEDRDIRHEQRFRVMGWLDGRLCFLVCTIEGDEIHAISLREADKAEERRYFKEVSPFDRH
jgi:uncharacterized DUF497 family protein